jgi:hypothetical protein
LHVDEVCFFRIEPKRRQVFSNKEASGITDEGVTIGENENTVKLNRDQ